MADSFLIGDDGILRCQAFEEFTWLSHGFGTRHTNPAASVTLRQVHSSIVVNALGVKDRQHDGDALITDEIGISVAVRAADCVPILLFDSSRHAVAAVHAGWRGSAAEIVSHTVRKMAVEFASEPVNLWAAIGPCIRECCYQVGPDVWALFHPFEEADGKRYLNLALANRQQLETAGVPSAQIFDSSLCTSCQLQDFFSFRREPTNPGRMLSAIARLS